MEHDPRRRDPRHAPSQRWEGRSGTRTRNAPTTRLPHRSSVIPAEPEPPDPRERRTSTKLTVKATLSAIRISTWNRTQPRPRARHAPPRTPLPHHPPLEPAPPRPHRRSGPARCPTSLPAHNLTLAVDPSSPRSRRSFHLPLKPIPLVQRRPSPYLPLVTGTSAAHEPGRPPWRTSPRWRRR